MNAKIAIWIGLLLIVGGVALGFTKQGQCGSVFQPRNELAADVNSIWDKMHGGDGADPCETATDYTVPVWILIGAGGVLAVIGGLMLAAAHETKQPEEQEA